MKAETRHIVEITKADWCLDLGRDDKTFGLQIVFHSKDKGWHSSLEFHGEAAKSTMIELGVRKTQDLVGKRILVKEDKNGYFLYVCSFPEPDSSPGDGYSYETVQDGYVIFDCIGRKVDPWDLVKILNKALELSGVM